MAIQASWKIVNLGSLGEFKNGVNFNKNDKGEGLGLINVKDLFNDSPYINFESLDKVNLSKRKGIDNFSVQAGDIFFSRSSVKRDGVGVVGIATRTDNKIIYCGFVIKFRLITKEVNPLFLAYLLRSEYYRKVIINMSGGSAIINISQDSLASLQINLPPLYLQQKIAAILSNYDDLIENNTRRIKILEEMAQTLYHEWFVKFRFPGHEQVKMVESELGLIPEGWEVRKLGELINIKHGYAFKGKFFSKEPTSKILLTPGNFAIGGGFQDDKYKYYDGDVPIEFILSAGDLLVTMTDLSKEGDTLGYPAFVPPSKTLIYLHNQRLGKIIIHNNLIEKYLLYYIFCSAPYRHHVLGTATGATVKHTAPDRIKTFKIPLPPSIIISKFESIVSLLHQKIICLSQKNNNLRITRDLLLPKLISGEIDVENLEIDTGKIAA